VEAERKVWQQKGELSRLTSENLLDAAGTYVDLLAAQSSLVIAEEAEGRLREALQQAARLAKIDPGVRVEVTRIEAEQAAQQGLTRKLRGAARGAEAKLAYLLGLPPTAQIAPADRRLVPLPLVDAGRPAEQLIEQALTAGPGVREVEGLLAVIDAARAQAEGPGKWLPAVEVNVVEAGFGAGPGSRLDWDNRLDLGVHLRWNLTEALTARERLRAADARVQQAHLGYDDLRAKLALGVREAREAALSGAEQLTFAEQRVRHAEEAARLSERRWQQNIKGRSPSEVLLAVRALAGARLELVQTVRDLDKAQLRLLVLTGGLGRK
jgi:outer membrane protein TolC